eukprot:s2032_g6.t1
MAERLILMVAEKPSIAATLTEALCPPQSGAQKRKGMSPSSPVYEYRGDFMGQPCFLWGFIDTPHLSGPFPFPVSLGWRGGR